MQNGAVHRLEEVLFSRVCDHVKGLWNIIEMIIISKIARFQDAVYEASRNVEIAKLDESDGLLHSFKNRCGLRQFMTHGQIGDLDEEVINAQFTHLIAEILQYDVSDAFNANG